MNQSLVDVALSLPLPQYFTYSVPPQLHDAVFPGSAVLVPFGRKTLTGIVIGTAAVTPTVTIKPIIDVIDFRPMVSDEDLRLSKWIAEYYHSSVGETLRLFLPAGFHLSSKRIVQRTNASIDITALTSLQQKIFNVLQHGPLSIQQLQKKTSVKNINATLAVLSSRGVVTIDEHLPTKKRIKNEWFFHRAALADPPSLKTEKQHSLWQRIEKMPDEDQEVRQFLKTFGASLSTLKSLAAKGFVSLYQKEVIRRSHIAPETQETKSLDIVMNPHQQACVKSITEAVAERSPKTFLLHGVTGSGKTQVYIEAIRQTLNCHRTAIVLIPEISLTPQTVRRFQVHFGDTVVWMHSRMSDGERYDAWRMVREGKYRIVIGPRSALFAPLSDLGLIIVDEEHEASYKQFDAHPRYHARDVAVMRAALFHAVTVLGSATPSIESYSNAMNGKYTLLTLPERVDHAVLPPVRIVNMVEERKRLYAEAKKGAAVIGKKAFEHLSRSVSGILEAKIRERLERKEGVILLQNRRGFAPFIECKSCGYVAQCERCNVTMTYHTVKKHMRCHYCGKVTPPPTLCPTCGGFEFTMGGFGTQRVEEELKSLFPDAVISRMDMDTTTRKGSHEKILKQFGSGDSDILLGTQMVAKGLDFPRVTLVGVISADTQMMLPDFRSAERTFQLLTQVAGRAGRSVLAGEVIIQTSQPHHYALKYVQEHDFIGFFNEEVQFRKGVNYPPFSRIVALEFKGKNEHRVERMATEAGIKLASQIKRSALLGPSPAALSKIKNEYRWQIILKADKEEDKNGTRARNAVARVVQEMAKTTASLKVKTIVDVDPSGLL